MLTLMQMLRAESCCFHGGKQGSGEGGTRETRSTHERAGRKQTDYSYSTGQGSFCLFASHSRETIHGSHTDRPPAEQNSSFSGQVNALEKDVQRKDQELKSEKEKVDEQKKNFNEDMHRKEEEIKVFVKKHDIDLQNAFQKGKKEGVDAEKEKYMQEKKEADKMNNEHMQKIQFEHIEDKQVWLCRALSCVCLTM